MIDLTPLDVRKKRGDFKKGLRGYDPEEVDGFLELVAERFEELVRQNLTLSERTERLEAQVRSQEGREKAVNDALVTAQQLREEIQDQARRDADNLVGGARDQAESLRRNAQAEADALLDRARADAAILRQELDHQIDVAIREANRRLEEGNERLHAMEHSRSRFIKGLRALVEQGTETLDQEGARSALDVRTFELQLIPGWREEALSSTEREAEEEIEAEAEAEAEVEAAADLEMDERADEEGVLVPEVDLETLPEEVVSVSDLAPEAEAEGYAEEGAEGEAEEEPTEEEESAADVPEDSEEKHDSSGGGKKRWW